MPRRLCFILEDNPARIVLMRQVLAVLLPHHEAVFVDDAEDAARRFCSLQAEVELISLDHDLDSVPRNEAVPRDHGDGRQVADAIARCTPTCPVIIHTSNAIAGDGMFYELQRAEWPVERVYPREQHAWIETAWSRAIRQLIDRGWVQR